MTNAKAVDTDHCKGCGSENLFSGYFYRGLAIDQSLEPRATWRTVCNQCGQWQDRPVRRGAER
jgi:hypothetical protein